MTAGVQSSLNDRKPTELSVDHRHRKHRDDREAAIRKIEYTKHQSVLKVRSQIRKGYPICLTSVLIFPVTLHPNGLLPSRKIGVCPLPTRLVGIIYETRRHGKVPVHW
jgi:hypothetical protein